MKGYIEHIWTQNMTDEQWHDYRLSGIGASEIATIMGLNPYQASIQLFYQKIGQIEANKEENAAMFFGTELESFVAKCWEHWDPSNPTPEAMISNYRAEKKIRRCQRVNAFVRNPKYPWLFVSLDRKINKVGGQDEKALEIKTISGYAADKWESGIPPMYLMQLQTQLLVCEFKQGELAILKDGRHMDVLPFEAHEGIQQAIIERTKHFWNSVIEARRLVHLQKEETKQGNAAMVEELQNQIDRLAPEPDDSIAYENYLKERYQNPGGGTLQGEDVHFDIAKQYVSTKEKIEHLETAATGCSNKLKSILGDYDVLDFGALGKVTWKANKNGVRAFKVSLKA